MRRRALARLSVIALTLGSLLTFLAWGRAEQAEQKAQEAPPTTSAQPAWTPEIPKVWDLKELASLQLPLATPSASPEYLSEDYYYKQSARSVYKAYPIYSLDKEPPGYLDWLKQQEPEVIFDPAKLKTKEDWIKAGEAVFNAPISYDTEYLLPDLRTPEWWKTVRPPLAKDGTIPFYTYIVRKKGVVEVGYFSCTSCHTRVMPDGTVVAGAQGNAPHDAVVAYTLRAQHAGPEAIRKFQYHLYAAPWLQPDPSLGILEQSVEEIAASHEAVPAGVIARQGASLAYPVVTADLIGLKDHHYFDRTGLVRHRGIADLMRYVSLNQDVDTLLDFGGFTPFNVFLGKLPEPHRRPRYTDEQLYALALYLYSLEPPPNPNRFDEAAARGKLVFEREGCPHCHTPPLYTSNKLTPATGFEVPAKHYESYEIASMSVGTDSGLTLKTRRGTGYYKVPSLKGVWYRGPFEHSGSVATLEDWFDPRRTREDYVPTGFRGPSGTKTRPVTGHPFGLSLPEKDRKELIAFLKTL